MNNGGKGEFWNSDDSFKIAYRLQLIPVSSEWWIEGGVTCERRDLFRLPVVKDV